MNDFYVADTYKNCKIVKEPYLKDGKAYVIVQAKCPRCGGSGHYSYNQRYGTVCFRCNGSGYESKEVRAYTEKEFEAFNRAKARAAERKAEEKARKEADLIENAEKYKHEIALKLGFNEKETIFLIEGDNTYAIKDYLKENGARFDPTLKWYSSEPFELPEGYTLFEMLFDEIYNYNPKTKYASFKENIQKILTAHIKIPETEFYPAAEKERIRNVTAIVSKITHFDNAYGSNCLYTFTSGKYVFVWFTAKCDLNLTIGETIDLTGTIKKFEEYDGINQTQLNRCIIKKIEE